MAYSSNRMGLLTQGNSVLYRICAFNCAGSQTCITCGETIPKVIVAG